MRSVDPDPEVKIVDPDPDPGGLNNNNEIEKSEIKSFEVLDVLYERPKASTLAWNSFMETLE
jgi:hypothetical protein